MNISVLCHLHYIFTVEHILSQKNAVSKMGSYDLLRRGRISVTISQTKRFIYHSVFSSHLIYFPFTTHSDLGLQNNLQLSHSLIVERYIILVFYHSYCVFSIRLSLLVNQPV